MCTKKVNSFDFLLTKAVFNLSGLLERKTQYSHQNMLISPWPNQTGRGSQDDVDVGVASLIIFSTLSCIGVLPSLLWSLYSVQPHYASSCLSSNQEQECQSCRRTMGHMYDAVVCGLVMQRGINVNVARSTKLPLCGQAHQFLGLYGWPISSWTQGI